MKKLTQEEFIEKCKQIHGNKYDYSKSIYVNIRTKICIICPEHGEFKQLPSAHLSGQGCKKCGYIKNGESSKLTIDQFIEKANKIHNNKYDYSKISYSNVNIKIEIICPIHGSFWQLASSHLQGTNCPKCYYENKFLTKEKFIERANIIHNNKYDYSKINYINYKTKIEIVCPEHGEFWTTPEIHLKGSNCPKCNLKLKIYTQEEFIDRAKEVHGNKYDYSKVKYINSSTKIKIICQKHGEFEQIPNNHLSGSGCPICNTSKYEEIIREFLEKNHINFTSQKIFKNLKKKKFDFYLPDYNLCIEYDGEFHYLPLTYKGCHTYEEAIQRLEITKQRDQIKNQYCKDNNIDLLRIPYWKKNNIEKILEKKLAIIS